MPERSEAEVTCRELVELVSDYLDEALPPATLDLVEEHLVLCDACREYVAQVRMTIGAVAGLPAEEPDAAMLRSLLGAFRDSVRDEGA
jgi:predicted anti-sigma-YlaC factor YlaD